MATRGQPFQMQSLQAQLCGFPRAGKFLKREKNVFFWFCFVSNGIPVKSHFKRMS